MSIFISSAPLDHAHDNPNLDAETREWEAWFRSTAPPIETFYCTESVCEGGWARRYITPSEMEWLRGSS